MELPRIRRICPCISVPITQQIEDLVIFLDFVPMYTHPLLSVQLNIIYQEFLWIVPTLYFRAKSGNMSVFFIVQALSPRTENMKDIKEADNLNLCVLHTQKLGNIVQPSLTARLIAQDQRLEKLVVTSNFPFQLSTHIFRGAPSLIDFSTYL